MTVYARVSRNLNFIRVLKRRHQLFEKPSTVVIFKVRLIFNDVNYILFLTLSILFKAFALINIEIKFKMFEIFRV